MGEGKEKEEIKNFKSCKFNDWLFIAAKKEIIWAKIIKMHVLKVFAFYDVEGIERKKKFDMWKEIMQYIFIVIINLLIQENCKLCWTKKKKKKSKYL